MFFNAEGRLRSLLVSWTSLQEQDLFAQAASGRSWFRTDDLLMLAALLREHPQPSPSRRRRCKDDFAVSVK